MKFDLMNSLDVQMAIAPVAARTDNTAIVSTVCSMAGAHSLMLALAVGTNTDANATFTVLIEESDAFASGFSAVADADLIGTEVLASYDYSDDAECRKIGYKGSKKYVRATVTPAGNDSGNIFLSGLWIRGHLELQPAANPPVQITS